MHGKDSSVRKDSLGTSCNKLLLHSSISVVASTKTSDWDTDNSTTGSTMKLSKDAVPCCQLNRSSGQEAFILGLSNLDNKSSPRSLKMNKEAKWNGTGHPTDECSNCALSQKNGDRLMYSTIHFNHRKVIRLNQSALRHH